MAPAGRPIGGTAGPAVPHGRGNVPNPANVPTKFRGRRAGFTPGRSPFRNVRSIRNFLRGWGVYVRQHNTLPLRRRPLVSARRSWLRLAWSVGWTVLLVLVPQAASQLPPIGASPITAEEAGDGTEGLVCCVSSRPPGAPGQCSERSERSDDVTRSCLSEAVLASEHCHVDAGTSEHPGSQGLGLAAVIRADDLYKGRPSR